VAFQFLSYLFFRISAKNHHSIHSPFIYNFVIKAIYTPKITNLSPLENIVTKCCSYFAIKNVVLFGNTKHLKSSLVATQPNINFNPKALDLIVIDDLDGYNKLLSTYSIHNDTMLVATEIHESKEKNDVWNKFVERQEVTASIDFYHCGILFFRKEQIKEHFKLRLSTSNNY